MLGEILKSINNYFIVDTHKGEWKIEDGVLNLPFLKENQYYLIEGSIFNDGVHQERTNLKDEEFTGNIYSLAIPQDFLDLVAEIEKFNNSKSGEASPYQSESFDGYSYTKASDSSGNPITWRNVFASRLNAWRKL